MTWTETLRTGWSAVTSHAMRSVLTVLGILIGIAAVILTVGLGLGTQKDVSAQISQLGSDLLIVRPGSSTSTEGVRGGFGSRTTLTTADAEALDSSVNPPCSWPTSRRATWTRTRPPRCWGCSTS